ncbi:inverted formin-2-like [Ptychodera flava]|uniref:inverted formin-2-like n=1 Tax=Ptychodera flava TaxID=63121 RepID=UPI003969BDC5
MAETTNSSMNGNSTPLKSDEKSNSGSKNVENCDPELCIQFLGVPKVANYEGIRTRLDTSTIEWMDVFLDKGGLTVLTENLAKFADRKLENDDAHLSLKCVDCIRVVLNKGIGMNYVVEVENRNLTENILLGLKLNDTATKIAVTEVLAAITSYSDNLQGYQSVINALDRNENQENRFSIIIEELKATESLPYKSALLAFVNSLICKIPDTSERCQRREDFIKLGILGILDQLRCDCEALLTQVKTFDKFKVGDKEEEMPNEVEPN